MTPWFATESSSLVEVLHSRVRREAESRAFTFLGDDGQEVAALSYGQLAAAASGVAERLLASGPAGSRAVLLYPPGLDFVTGFLGCLCAGWVPVPAALPRSPAGLATLSSLVNDVRPEKFLTHSSLTGPIEAGLQAAGIGSRSVLSTDGLESRLSLERLPLPKSEDLAFLQYTSGSTGTAKGVMVRHRNILANGKALAIAGRTSEVESFVGWLPLFHDMGLMSIVMLPLLEGKPSISLAPTTFLRTPLRWLEAISGVEHSVASGGPNFAFDLCVRKVSDADAAKLDLGRWAIAFCGAELVRSRTLRAFQQKFAAAGLRPSALLPCYGMAESTLFITGRKGGEQTLQVDREALARNLLVEARTDAGSHALVSCGEPAPEHEVRIVDPDTLKTLPEGRVGEIWVRGPSTCDGYFQRPSESAQVFAAYTRDTPPDGPFLRSGDLAALRESQLFVTGRLKDLLIIRGRNIHPGDLEQTAEAASRTLRAGCGAAFSVDIEGEEQVALCYEVQAGTNRDLQAVLLAVRTALGEQHGVTPYQIRLVASGLVPRTTSGKVRRAECRRLFLAGELRAVAEWVAPRAPVETEAATLTEASQTRASQGEILGRLLQIVSSLTFQATGEADPHMSFYGSGLDSVKLASALGELSEWLAMPISPSLAFDYPTPWKLASALSGLQQGNSLPRAEKSNAVRAGEQDERSVAVVGMSCRFPGGESLDRFWELIEGGHLAIREVPSARWELDAFYDPKLEQSDKMNTRFGGFLEHIEDFDAQFFEVSPNEAAETDPQQRLLLEVAWEALEDAGLPADQLAGSNVGVFVGVSSCDFYKSLLRTPSRAGTGVANSIAANRLSYFFDFKGPSMAVDTACSSSLVAVHLALRSLRDGECDVAVVGGVNAILSPEVTVAFSQAGMMAADGVCRSFDADARGYVRGEGCGVVVLKRLRDAEANGDRIRAVVLGSALTQDGRSNGLTAPSGLAQQRVLRGALADAGLAAKDVDLVEAHGSGTPLGDVIEVQSIAAVLGEGRAAHKKWLLGSVKANIGHLEAAAGIAGFIKTVLTLERGFVPPHPSFRRLNPKLLAEQAQFTIPLAGSPASKPTTAGVSSFGFGGTNAHVILRVSNQVSQIENAEGTSCESRLFCLSAKSEAALRALARAFLEHFAEPVGANLSDVCFSAQTGRTHFSFRFAAVVAGWEDWRRALREFVDGAPSSGWVYSRIAKPDERKVVFEFQAEPGPTNIETVLRFAHSSPAFREALALFGTPASAQASDRVALFLAQYSLWRVWQGWGVAPDVIRSRGLGRAAAACAAGTLAAPEALSRLDALEHEGDVGWAVQELKSPSATQRTARDALVQFGALVSAEATWQKLLRNTAELYTLGVDLDWQAFNRGSGNQRITLPSYAFQRRRCWPDASTIKTYGNQA